MMGGMKGTEQGQGVGGDEASAAGLTSPLALLFGGVDRAGQLHPCHHGSAPSPVDRDREDGGDGLAQQSTIIIMGLEGMKRGAKVQNRIML